MAFYDDPFERQHNKHLEAHLQGYALRKLMDLGFVVDIRSRFGSVKACDIGILTLALAREEASGQEVLPHGTFSVNDSRAEAI